MSWFSDSLAGIGRTTWGGLRDYAQFANSIMPNPIAQNVQNFSSDQFSKMDLRGAEVESMLSGFPILGNFIKGISGVQQLEDLYDRTGKTPAYVSNAAAGIGKGISQLSRKIEAGVNDLYEYYSGEKDSTDDHLSFDQLLKKYHDNGDFVYGDEL